MRRGKVWSLPIYKVNCTISSKNVCPCGTEAIVRYYMYHRMQKLQAKERIIKNMAIGSSYIVEGMNRITLKKACAPYNTTAQSILNNAGDISRIKLTWVYR